MYLLVWSELMPVSKSKSKLESAEVPSLTLVAMSGSPKVEGHAVERSGGIVWLVEVFPMGNGAYVGPMLFDGCWTSCVPETCPSELVGSRDPSNSIDSVFVKAVSSLSNITFTRWLRTCFVCVATDVYLRRISQMTKILRMWLFACCAWVDSGEDSATVQRTVPAVNKLIPRYATACVFLAASKQCFSSLRPALRDADWRHLSRL